VLHRRFITWMPIKRVSNYGIDIQNPFYLMIM